MAPYFAWHVGRCSNRVSRAARRPSAARRCRLFVEALEERTVLSTFAADDATGIIGAPVSTELGPAAVPLSIEQFASTSPTGFTPAQIRRAYGFDQVMFGSITGDGRGQTIAIIDAYNHPYIGSDLHAFDAAFGLPDPPSFEKYWQTLGGQPPANDPEWALEIALDVECAHAMAPAANLLLVEAYNNSVANLFATVAWAAAQNNVSVVSMSFGVGEWSSETSYDSTFQTPAGHQGVTFIAASGDRSTGGSYLPASPYPIYPAASPNVAGVGGTSLYLDASGNYGYESAWSGSGGGISQYESQPSYQQGMVTQSSTSRVSPDVAFVADPNTGVAVYDSYATGGWPWLQAGGTSVSAPVFAGLIATVNEGRAINGYGSLDGATETLAAIYGLPNDFRDITTGGPPVYPATVGYDPATGFGTPISTLLVSGLVYSGTAVHEANMKFVAAVYQDVLGRAVDPASQLSFALQLDRGTPRSVVVNAVDHSAEYYANVIIAPAYQDYLGRSPDAAGLAFWVSQMQYHGLTDEQLEAGFIASNEFYARAGGTDSLWADAMYLDLLGRQPDPLGEAYWVQQLSAGASRTSIAYGFAASLERERRRITDDYLHYLGRQPEAQGLDYWLSQFASGATNEDLITGIVSSDEFYYKHA